MPTTTTSTCDHSIYWDQDELKCRACGRSLSYPARPPDPSEGRPRPNVGRRGPRNTPPPTEPYCVACRLQGQPDLTGNTICPGCDETVAVADVDGNLQLPPYDPPRLLQCACCGRALPPVAFSRDAKAIHRESRNANCRTCLAVRARSKRQVNPEAVRAVDRERRVRYLAGSPDRKMKHRGSRAANNEAVQRYVARKRGETVPKLRAGRPIILKAIICREPSCPLAAFCVEKTTEAA